ncbi:MAG: aminotransferase class I/II-fold pyridoxal phosphate-dependent enzyme, partial [Thermomonas sp.]
MQIAELRRSAELAEREGVHVRALAVINPGNPTGQCLTEANMREIIKFCQEKHVVLLADEVYQVCSGPG